MTGHVRLSAITSSVLLLGALMFPTRQVEASADLNRVIELTNEHRRAAGCADLRWQPQLADAAQRHAGDMAANNYFSHTGRDGSTFAGRIKGTGYVYRRAAENIAAGYATPDDVVAGWMSSPGHRANILNCSLRDIGIGLGSNSASDYGNYWVQDFGLSR